jgi:SagB-type dehydrogenase family enzyme
LAKGKDMYNKNMLKFLIFSSISIFLCSFCIAQQQEKVQSVYEEFDIKLHDPERDSNVSLEESLNNRRSIRDYLKDPLSLSDISQILWAAQGITKIKENPPSSWQGKEWMGGRRTAPSAGGLYPIELYLAVGKVKDLSPGLYKYHPKLHSIRKVMESDKRNDISNAALKQRCIKEGAISIIIVGVYKITENKYGNRAKQYVQIECGAVCQNIYLQSYALGLGTVFVGAFKDQPLKLTLNLPEDEFPLGIMPIGKL